MRFEKRYAQNTTAGLAEKPKAGGEIHHSAAQAGTLS